MKQFLTILCALMLCSCSSNEGVSLADVDVVGVESVALQGSDLPEQLTLRLELNNEGRKFSVRSARLRVGIGIRRSVAITLLEPVVVGRGESVVEIPVKFTVAHSSRAVALRRALERREFSLIAFDGEAKVRRGIAARTFDFSSPELKLTFDERWAQWLMQLLEENTNE